MMEKIPVHSPITSIEEPFSRTKVPLASASNPKRRRNKATKEAVKDLGMIYSSASLK